MAAERPNTVAMNTGKKVATTLTIMVAPIEPRP